MYVGKKKYRKSDERGWEHGRQKVTSARINEERINIQYFGRRPFSSTTQKQQNRLNTRKTDEKLNTQLFDTLSLLHTSLALSSVSLK